MFTRSDVQIRLSNHIMIRKFAHQGKHRNEMQRTQTRSVCLNRISVRLCEPKYNKDMNNQTKR